VILGIYCNSKKGDSAADAQAYKKEIDVARKSIEKATGRGSLFYKVTVKVGFDSSWLA
jgi:hypothetical protein